MKWVCNNYLIKNLRLHLYEPLIYAWTSPASLWACVRLSVLRLAPCQPESIGRAWWAICRIGPDSLWDHGQVSRMPPKSICTSISVSGSAPPLTHPWEVFRPQFCQSSTWILRNSCSGSPLRPGVGASCPRARDDAAKILKGNTPNISTKS